MINSHLCLHATDAVDAPQRSSTYKYPAMTKTMSGGGEFSSVFKLHVEPGQFTDSEIIVMLGENGTGQCFLDRLWVMC